MVYFELKNPNEVEEGSNSQNNISSQLRNKYQHNCPPILSLNNLYLHFKYQFPACSLLFPALPMNKWKLNRRKKRQREKWGFPFTISRTNKIKAYPLPLHKDWEDKFISQSWFLIALQLFYFLSHISLITNLFLTSSSLQ